MAVDARLGQPAHWIGEALNRKAMGVMPCIPLGFYWQCSVWRKNLTGVVRSPATIFRAFSKA